MSISQDQFYLDWLANMVLTAQSPSLDTSKTIPPDRK